MAEDTPTYPAPIDAEALQRAIAALQPPQAATQAPSGADEGDSSQGWFGHLLARIGNAEAGGPTGLLGLTRDQADTAGLRAMLASGVGMLAASGPSYVPKDFGTVLAAGIGNAMQSRQGSEGAAFTARGALNAQQQQAFQNRLSAMKEALPLLQLDYQQKLLDAQRRAALAATGGRPGSISDAANVPAYGGAANAPQMPAEYEPYFQAASKETGIPVDVLKAQAAQESGFNPNAKGAAGEIGLFQIKPDTATKPGFGLQGVSSPDVLRDPATNIMFGARYLKARAGNADLSTPAGQAAALQAYNGGGDQNYVANVFRYMPKGGTQDAVATPPPAAPGRGVAARTGGTDVAGPAAGKATPDAPAPPALPTPPEPPAEGIPVPGGSGMRVYPDGRIGTPGQEGRPPATQVATADTGTKTDATPPPAATTAPAVTAPPAAITPPPVTPTTIPDTFTEFKRQHPEELTPSDEERATWDTRPDPEQVKNIQQQRQDAQDRIRAARAAIPTSTDPSKQTAEIAAAKKDLDTAITAENTMREDARKTGMERRASWYKDREAQMATSYNDAVKARDARRTAQDATANAINEQTGKDALATFNNARGVVTQLHGFQAISDGIDQPGWMNTTRFPWSDHTVAEQLQQMGVLGDNAKSKLAASQLLSGGMINIVKTLRAGMPMGSLSDRDLTFIERMGPTQWMDKDTRTAAVRYLMQAYQAQKDYSQTVLKELSKPGGNYAAALDAAEKQAGPIVPTVTDRELGAHWDDPTGDWPTRRLEWARANKAPVGTLIHLPDGSVHVISKKPAEQP